MQETKKNKTTDRMIEKMRVILEGYRSGDKIILASIASKLQRMDNRIQMGEKRVGKLLSMLKDSLVVRTNTGWIKK